MIGTIHDIPTTIPTMNIGQLTAINQAWTHNAMQLGYFCLAVGFLIGVGAGYIFCKRYHGLQ